MNSFLNATASAGDDDDDDACGGNADFKMDMVDVFGDVCHHVDIDISDFRFHINVVLSLVIC